MEFFQKILSMFQVGVEDLLANKFQLMVQDTKVTPNIVDTWYYWEYELYIKMLNKRNKDEKETQEKQESEQGSKYNFGNFSPGKMFGNMNSSMPKMPKF